MARTRIPLARPSTPSPSTLRRALEAHGHVLLYDGVCGLCNRFVQFILARDAGGTLRFATLQGRYGEEARRLLPDIASVDSVVLLYKDGALLRSTAAIEVLRYLGGGWALAAIGYLIPRMIRDWIYDRVASMRYRAFGRLASCPVPSEETRARFLD
jgi:predicted DCC family thiol-disulfide oxidoreductase YuxK